jgi:hypothetical protein
MAYGTGKASAKRSAQDAAALNAWEKLEREGAAAQNTSDIHMRESQHRRSRHSVERRMV